MKTIELSDDEQVELVEALNSKILSIRRGDLGPEIERGGNRRWIADLRALIDKINEVFDD